MPNSFPQTTPSYYSYLWKLKVDGTTYKLEVTAHNLLDAEKMRDTTIAYLMWAFKHPYSTSIYTIYLKKDFLSTDFKSAKLLIEGLHTALSKNRAQQPTTTILSSKSEKPGEEDARMFIRVSNIIRNGDFFLLAPRVTIDPLLQQTLIAKKCMTYTFTLTISNITYNSSVVELPL